MVNDCVLVPDVSPHFLAIYYSSIAFISGQGHFFQMLWQNKAGGNSKCISAVAFVGLTGLKKNTGDLVAKIMLGYGNKYLLC